MNYIAIDIGGSAIKAAIIDSEGNILEKTSHTTPLTCFDDFMDTLYLIVDWALALKPISGIALSQPCVTDPQTSEALSEGALIYIRKTNPSKILGEKYNLPFAAENDGNCAAFAELWVGGAKDYSNVAVVVCGSGVGGAVVIDRKVITGHGHIAGEFGMFVTGFEADGSPIIWSANGSTLALVKSFAKAKNLDPNSLNGKIVFEYAERGDYDALSCISDFYRIFSYGVHNIQHVYAPEIVLIGGAISERPDFIPNLENALNKLYTQVPMLLAPPKVAQCLCGNDANLIGAVANLINKAQ